MSRAHSATAAAATREAAPPPSPAALARAQWRQLAWITAGALAIFFGLRFLPTGTNLSHMDFRVDAKGVSSIEFCDPLNPQFIPVVAARSPVTMAIVTREPAASGREVHATVTLKTSRGKAIAPDDLLVTHTRRLHLLVVDPTLADYQHVHPEPGAPGEWTFAFTPHAAGTYRVFADFTPAATGRGLYAHVELEVPGTAPARLASIPARGTQSVERDGTRFTLTAAQPVLRAGQPIDLRFAMQRTDGGAVPLEPVMGAYSHLVAFDEARTGFAHLHPTEVDLLKKPDAIHPVLNFKLTIPRAGHYVIWAQVNLGGHETFVPLPVDVVD